MRRRDSPPGDTADTYKSQIFRNAPVEDQPDKDALEPYLTCCISLGSCQIGSKPSAVTLPAPINEGPLPDASASRRGLLAPRSSIPLSRKTSNAIFSVSLLLLLGVLLAVYHMHAGGSRTLVMYIFSDSDPESINNLRFFVREGMRPHDGCDYVIVVQQGDMENGDMAHGRHVDEQGDDTAAHNQPQQSSSGGNGRAARRSDASTVDDGLGSEDWEGLLDTPDDPDLPVLPRNARYVYHKNECYDWGTFGWLLATKQVVLSRYRYFIFMNSSVRGPFLAPHLAALVGHWTDLFTRRLVRGVRAVGPAISCEGTPFRGNKSGQWRRNPHVQSYLLATDRIGLSLMQREGSVFSCHRDRWDAIWYGEVGSSAAILAAGAGIDCLMIRYQGVDWLNHSNWGCNGGSAPNGLNYYDGIDLDPYEAVFVKYKAGQAEEVGLLSSVRRAAQYGSWQKLAASGRLSSEAICDNAYSSDPLAYQAAALLDMANRGDVCFDTAFYLRSNPDLMELMYQFQDIDALWEAYGTEEDVSAAQQEAEDSTAGEVIRPSSISPNSHSRSKSNRSDDSDSDGSDNSRNKARLLGAEGSGTRQDPAARSSADGAAEAGAQGAAGGEGGASAVREQGMWDAADKGERDTLGTAATGKWARAASASLWTHWVLTGQFEEDRPARFTCQWDLPQARLAAIMHDFDEHGL